MMAKAQVSGVRHSTHSPAHMTNSSARRTGALRGVSCLRLSVLTDETTSPERQQGANEGAACALGIDLADRKAVDLGVSASKTTPFERPELGKWLRKPDAYDALLFWRFDRAIRSMDDMHELAKWARDHRKMVIFAEGPGGRLVLDFRNPLDPMAQLMVTLFAFAAQMEAHSIRERVTGAQAAMRMMAYRWRGSRAPYGYKPVPLEGGGWTLEQDKDAVKVIERIIKALLTTETSERAETVNSIVHMLNADGVPCPAEHWAKFKGRKLKKPTRWNPTTVTRILRSETLIGWKMSDGKPVRDGLGVPVLATDDPILTRAEFDAIGALLDGRKVNNPAPRTDTNALLFGIVHCSSCGGRMYYNNQESKPGQRPTYRCGASARGEICKHPMNIRADWVEEYVTREFLRILGGLEITHTRTVPGYDPQPEIDDTTAEYEAHMAQQGRQKSKAAATAWQNRADALDARLTELEAREKIEARTEEIRTGRTYDEKWVQASTAGRRKMLTNAGARLDILAGTPGGWRTLDERRVSLEIRDPFFDAAADALTAVVAEIEYVDNI
ncbi:recombinase family protein [Streptomyces angustmyceticus]|uniref:recombinase family protein n=1 Tax=Streptomyces angustmyceticus TaxID=285578 RepID=UPI0036A52B2E